MLYATVRNRKISVKKPTTIPCNGKNVDFLTLDLDEDWSGIKSILCTFSNDHLVSQKKKKIVTETTKTVTTTKDEQNISSVETVDKKTEYAEFTEGDEEDVGVTTSTETIETTDGEDEGDVEIPLPDGTEEVTKITTTIKKIITVSIVEVSESQTVKRGVLYFPGAGNVVKIPHACVVNEGQLSVWLTGYDAEIVAPDGDIEDPEQFTTDSTKVLTMATPDSFWELVENGEPDWTPSDDEATTLYDDAMAAVGRAEAAANAAKATADDLSNKAASGEFNGTDGRTPQISVGTVETTEAGGEADVTASGTATDVKLNFKLPRGEKGEDGETPSIKLKPIDPEQYDGRTGVSFEVELKGLAKEAIIFDGLDGADGFSPVVSILPIEGGNRVTITDKDGEESFDVMNGTGGGGNLPNDVERTSNRVTVINEDSDDNHYPSAKAVFDIVGNIEANLDNIIALQESLIEQSPTPVNLEVEE